MKKYFSIAVLCALAVLGLGSCAKDIEEEIVTEQTGVRTVNFSASLADQTKTGLSMKFVPNWINTSLENVHLFETYGSTILEGVDLEMRVPEDRNNEVAYFKADFAEEISIIVNPPSPSGVLTRASGEYTYTGIVAQKVDGKFTVPANQVPDPVSLIDPNADFLVGDTKTTFSESMALKEMDIYFVRPVSVSRLAIMNIEGQKVKTVKITSTDKLTGSAAYSDVNFSDGTVNWDNSGSNVLTISYGEGKEIPVEATFYAYFISLPGNKNVTSIEVTTDQYVYTKSFASGKTLKFDTVEFRNIAVDMSKVTPTPIGPDTPVYQDLYFFKNAGHVSEDSYDLYPGTTPYVTPELRGAATGANVTYSIVCTPAGVATISTDGVVTPAAVGTAVITATASAVTGYKETEVSYTLTVTDSTPDAVDQDLSFVKGGETVTTDTFDLYPAGGTYTPPTLTGAAEGATVTYAIECTPEGVATIDASTGAVTPVAVGTAVITATATAVAPLYKQTSKSYTLTVTDSTPAPVEEVTYTLVTASGTLTKGTYILISDDSSSSYNNRYTVALFPTVITTSWEGSTPVSNGQRFNEKDVTLDGSSITTTDAEIVNAEIELVPDGSNWKIKAKKTGEYLATPTANYTIPLTLNADEAAAFTISSAQNRSITVGGYYFFHSGSATGFTIRNTGSTVSNIRFYKKVLKTQALSFSAEAAQYDLKDGSWNPAMPTLDKTGAVTEVTCTSSDETVATVNANGVVTIASGAKKGDTAVITAEAPANDEYDAATASYTLSIVDTTPGVMVTYKKVTNTAELVAGGKYIVVYESGSKVFKPFLTTSGTSFSKSTDNVVNVTIASNAITSDALGDCEMTLESGYYLFVDAEGKYIYPVSSGGNTFEAETTKSHALTITFSNGIASIKNGNYNIYYSTNSSWFSSTSTASSVNTALYKLDDGTTPTPVVQTIAFTPAAAGYDLYTKAWTPSQPVLGGAQTPVSYESSDPTVASVAADGTITPLKEGEVTVTATAEASAAYQAATATCTITVTDSTPDPGDMVTIQLKKATALTAGQKYVLVSNGYALIKNGDDAGVVAVGGADLGSGTITISVPSASRDNVEWTLEEKAASSVTRGNKYVFTNGSDYFGIAMNTNPSTYTYTVEVNEGRTVSTNVTIQDHNIDLDNNYIYYRGNSSSYYIFYNTSSSSWDNEKVGSSATPATTSKTALYVVDDGSTPEPPTPTNQYYTKINSRDDLPGTSQTSATGDYLFVYENGTKAYVFKAILPDGTEPTGSGSSSSGHVELVKTGSAIEVDLTENGILATDAVKDCKIQLAHHSTATRNDWNVKPNRLGTFWIRVNNDRNNGVRILAMTSAGYSATFTFDGTGNNLEILRTDSSRNAYWSYNATDNCFEATSTASKISIYKLSE